jgi:hypothetical protein
MEMSSQLHALTNSYPGKEQLAPTDFTLNLLIEFVLLIAVKRKITISINVTYGI